MEPIIAALFTSLVNNLPILIGIVVLAYQNRSKIDNNRRTNDAKIEDNRKETAATVENTRKETAMAVEEQRVRQERYNFDLSRDSNTKYTDAITRASSAEAKTTVLERTISDLTQNNMQRDTLAGEAKSEIGRLKASIDNLTRTIAGKDSEIASLKKIIEDSARTFTEALAQKQRQIDGLIAGRESERAAWQKSFDALQMKMDTLQTKFDALTITHEAERAVLVAMTPPVVPSSADAINAAVDTLANAQPLVSEAPRVPDAPGAVA